MSTPPPPFLPCKMYRTDIFLGGGQLYEELGELAFNYYFTIPSYYILVMRAFVTLEGIALSADDGGEFNMYRATAPYARRKLLNPSTPAGRALLKAALLTPEGRHAIAQQAKGGRGSGGEVSRTPLVPSLGRLLIRLIRELVDRGRGIPSRLGKLLQGAGKTRGR